MNRIAAASKDRIRRIRQALSKAGMVVFPDETTADLADYGFDSLMMALSVLELEREFKITLKNSHRLEEKMQSLHSIDTWIADRS